MKRFLFIFFFVASYIYVNAATMWTIHTKSNGDVNIVFSEKPKVTFSGNTVHIVSTNATYDFPMSDITTTSFSQSTDVIGTVENTKVADTGIKIYSTNGTLLRSIAANASKTTFSTEDLPAGTYIVKNGTLTYKIIKK